MLKSKLLATAFAVAALSFSNAYAADTADKTESCEVNGKTFEVPVGQCKNVQGGDFSGLTPELAAQIKGEAAPQ